MPPTRLILFTSLIANGNEKLIPLFEVGVDPLTVAANVAHCPLDEQMLSVDAPVATPLMVIVLPEIDWDMLLPLIV